MATVMWTFMMNVKSRYLAISGIVMDVGGRILETSSRKTTNASRIEIHVVIAAGAHWCHLASMIERSVRGGAGGL